MMPLASAGVINAHDVMSVLALLRTAGVDIWIGGGGELTRWWAGRLGLIGIFDLMHRIEQEPSVVAALAEAGFGRRWTGGRCGSWSPTRPVRRSTCIRCLRVGRIGRAGLARGWPAVRVSGAVLRHWPDRRRDSPLLVGRAAGLLPPGVRAAIATATTWRNFGRRSASTRTSKRRWGSSDRPSPLSSSFRSARLRAACAAGPRGPPGPPWAASHGRDSPASSVSASRKRSIVTAFGRCLTPPPARAPGSGGGGEPFISSSK